MHFSCPFSRLGQGRKGEEKSRGKEQTLMLSHWLLWSCGGEAPGPADSYFASSRITPSTTELPGSPGASERVCVSVCVCVGDTVGLGLQG